MDANEAQTAYKSLKAQLDAGQIPIDDYNRKVGELRYQDNTGTWWAVSPADGSWLKWTGSAWVPAFAQAVPAAPQAPVQPASRPAVQQPVVKQPAAKPSWYIPPVSSGPQKPAAGQHTAAQPVQHTVPQPVVQPAASSYYIPPSGSVQQPAVPQPVGAVVQPAVAGIAKPARNWAGIVSLILSILSWIFYPYVMGILAIVLGGYSIYSTRKITGKIAFIAIAAIVIAIASMAVDFSYIAIVAPDNLPPLK